MESDVLQESVDKLKESYFHLWEGLLTTGGFLITIGVGLSAFGRLDNAHFSVKILLFVMITLLILSCYLIIYIFYLLVDSYKKISEILKGAIDGEIRNEDLISDKYVDITGKNYNRVQISQKIIFLCQLFASILIILLTYYLLFFQRTTIRNKDKEILVPQYKQIEILGPYKNNL